VRRLLKTTRGRLTLLWVAIFAGALTVADVGVYLAVGFAANDTTDRELRSQAAAVGSALRYTGAHVTYVGGELPHESRSGVLIDMAVVGPWGVELLTHEQPLSDATLESLARPVLRSGRPTLVDFYDSDPVHRRAYVMAAPSGTASESLVVVAATPLTDVESSITRAMLLAVLLSLGTLFGSARLVHWLIGRVLSPVSQIASLAESLSERDLHRRVEVHAPDDEVGQLVRTFNLMLARLEASFSALRSFTADASHELRSPLALMASELDYVLGKPRAQAEREQTLRVLREEVQHMTGMVEKLLMLARADAGQLEAALQPLDVIDFVHETVARWLATAAGEDVKVEVQVPDSGSAIADLSLARRILDNLLDNAIRHSPAGGRVRVAACRSGGGWQFEVADQGPGVPLEHADRAFERFARADSARARDGDRGAGLGLPLSLAFARVQGGELRLVEVAGWGAVFRLWLPDAGPGVESYRAARRA
jgi:signal transduction histidine kinase